MERNYGKNISSLILGVCMDFRTLLIQSISLLFWEAQLEGEGLDSKDLIRQLISELPDLENVAGTDDDRNNLTALKDIVISLCLGSTKPEQNAIKERIKLGIKRDPELREDVESLLSGDTKNLDIVQSKIESIRNEIQRYIREKNFRKTIQNIAKKGLYTQTQIDIAKVAQEAISELENFTKFDENQKDPAVNDYADTTDPETIAKIFARVQDDVNPESVMKTGWQDLNKLLGTTGGIRRGSMYVVGAMPYNGKSLVSMDITCHVGMFNTPFLMNPEKKAAIVHFSTENDLQLNFRLLYQRLKEQETGTMVDMLGTDPVAMANYVIGKLEQNGYKYFFYYLNSAECNWRKISTELLKIESMGYEVHLCTIDYLAMLDYEDLPGGNEATQIQLLFNRIRSFCNPRGIATIIPHQISTEAALLKRQGTDDFVKQIAGKRYWARCRSIDMEVDCEIYLNVEKDAQGKSWMAFGRGKDRNSANTPYDDQFFFQPFEQFGGLVPDIHGKCLGKHTIRDSGFATATANDWGGSSAADNEFAI